MNRARVLFLCTGNACRSQMAEGWLRHLAGDRFEALSAGTDPHGLDARAVAAMAAAGVDIAQQTSKSIDAFRADPPELVVTVCDRAADQCPTLPGAPKLVHWPFPDPAAAQGSAEDVRAVFETVRDAIRVRIERWLAGHPCESVS